MTLEDFYAEVLQKLGTLAAEEAPSASDRKASKEKYEQIHAEFSRRDLIQWFDDEDVPDWASDPMATIVADRLAPEFSLPDNRRIELKVAAREALDTIIADGQRRSPPDVAGTYY